MKRFLKTFENNLQQSYVAHEESYSHIGFDQQDQFILLIDSPYNKPLLRMEAKEARKKVKENTQPVVQVPKNIIVNFINNRNTSLGVYEMPVSAGPKEFQQLVNSMLPEDQKDEFNFFFKTKEIKNKLSVFFQQISYSNFEANFDIIYHPVSNFKVRPVTRSSSSLYGHSEAVLSLNFSPDCQNLASGSGDGTVRLWDVFTQTPLKEIKADNWVMIVLWSPDAERLAYAQKNGNITVYTPENENQVQLLGHTKFVTSLAWIPLHLSKTCNRLVSASKDNTLRLWNTDSGTCERSFGVHIKCVTKVLWSGQNQIVSCSEDQRICCFDSNGAYLRELKRHSHWVNTMSLSTEHVIKRGCYEPGRGFEGKDKQERALELYRKAVEHHKERLVTGSDDFTLMLFQLPSKVPIKQMVGHGKPVNHVIFSPDGRYIASGSFDKKIKLWDGYTGEFMCTFDGHVGPVYVMSWSVDSRFIISASQDSTLKLWDLKTRKLMMDLPGHADQIYALDWDINGRLVASGGKDRQVKLWTH